MRVTSLAGRTVLGHVSLTRLSGSLFSNGLQAMDASASQAAAGETRSGTSQRRRAFLLLGDSERNGSAAMAGPVRLNLLIAGSYAWAVTVATPAWGSRRAAAILCSAGALLALFGGILGSRRMPKAGRALTMAGFLGLSCVTWLVLGPALDVDKLEPVRSALGALGWFVFALGWGSVRHPRAIPEDDPRVIREAEPLLPRRALPRATLTVFAVTVAVALLPWLFAWTVERREHALLAHVLGLGLAMWLLGVGIQSAVTIGAVRAWAKPPTRLGFATPALAWAAALLVVGLAYAAAGGN